MRVLYDLCLYFVSMTVTLREREGRGKEMTCVAINRRMEGWKDDFAVFIYTPVFTVS